MCQAIVRQHGGDIQVSSVLGAGTTFRLFLPRHAGPAPEPRSSHLRVFDVEKTQGRRVLVVDDEERLLQLTVDALTSKLGCVVERACDGGEAVTALQRGTFDLVLSDVRMPR